MWAQVRHLAIFPESYERVSLTHFSHCFFLLSFSSSLHLCHYLQSTGQVIIFPFLKVAFETIYLRLRFESTWQGLCAVLSPSVMSWGLEPGQNPWCLISGPNEAQVLDVSLKKELIERHGNKR